MRIFLATGGARAGKSDWAEAEAARLAGDDVTFVATAERRDEEMGARIDAHRAARRPGWTTLEAPFFVPRAVRDAEHALVIVDCLTLWVSNLLLAGPEDVDLDARTDHVRRRVEDLVQAAGSRAGTLIVVTNEVGLGLVPDNLLARTYRDLLGWANARIAREADRVVLLVAGIPVDVR